MGVLISVNLSPIDLGLLVLKWCTTYFPCHSDKMPGWSNFKEEGWTGTSGLRGRVHQG